MSGLWAFDDGSDDEKEKSQISNDKNKILDLSSDDKAEEWFKPNSENDVGELRRRVAPYSID